MLHPLKVGPLDPLVLSEEVPTYTRSPHANNVQSASSYECDGCSHHASFHSMENKTEDDVRKRWEQEAKEKADRDEETQQRPKKRVRAIEYQNTSGSILGNNAIEGASDSSMGATKAGGNRRGAAKKPARAAASRARGKVTEVFQDEEDDVIEVD